MSTAIVERHDAPGTSARALRVPVRARALFARAAHLGRVALGVVEAYAAVREVLLDPTMPRPGLARTQSPRGATAHAAR